MDAGLWQSVNLVLMTGATILLAAFTARYVKLTNKLAVEAEARSLPSVYIDIELEGNEQAILMIGNAGPTPAQDLRFTAVDNVAWEAALGRTLANNPVIQNGLSYLAPGRKSPYWIGFFDWAKVEQGESVIDVDVEYSTITGRRLASSFKIDLNLYQGSYAPRLRDPVQRIAESVADLHSLKDREQSTAESRRMIESMGLSRVACRYCCEQISSTARKCPHCHEFLRDEPAGSLLLLFFKWLARQARKDDHV